MAAWAAALIGVEAYALYDAFDFSVLLSLSDTVNFNLLIATAGYVTYISMRYYQPNAKNVVYLIVWDVESFYVVRVCHNYLMTNGRFWSYQPTGA